MDEIRFAAYFQFALGVLSIIVGFIGGAVSLWPFLLIGLGMLAGGAMTLMSER